MKSISGTHYPVFGGYINTDPKNPNFKRLVFYSIEFLDASNFLKFRVKTEHTLEIPAPLEDFGDLKNSRLVLAGNTLTILTNKRILRIHLEINEMKLDKSKAPEIDQFVYCHPKGITTPESYVSIISEIGYYILLRYVSSSGYFKSHYVGFINKKTRESSCLGNTSNQLHSFSAIQENKLGGDSSVYPSEYTYTVIFSDSSIQSGLLKEYRSLRLNASKIVNPEKSFSGSVETKFFNLIET